ncbi:hypothetical protein [Spirosoma pulveris]
MTNETIRLVDSDGADQRLATRLGARGYHLKPFVHQQLIESTNQWPANGSFRSALTLSLLDTCQF